MEQQALLEPEAPEETVAILTFTVQGTPVPQGSWKAFNDRYGHARAIPSNKAELNRWRKLVADTAMASRPVWLREPWDGPVRSHFVYTFERSPNDYLADGVTLCKGARRFHEVPPDRDKLDRAVNDALSGIVFVSDARNIGGPSEKRYGLPGETSRAEIEVVFLRP